MIELNDKESGMVGGYTYDQNHFNEKLSNMFSEILSGNLHGSSTLSAHRRYTTHQLSGIDPQRFVSRRVARSHPFSEQTYHLLGQI